MAGLKHREMRKWKLELKQLDSVWYGRSTKFKNSGGGGSPQGKNLEEPLMETRIKKVVLYEILREGLMKMCWLRTMEDMHLLQKHQAKGKRGLEGTGLGQASCFIP